jgi:CDP-diacylglycerol--glycerol-3-phosphate 3-phosphatidyltransferase
MRALFGYVKAAGFVFLAGLVAWETKDTSDTALGALYSQQSFRWFGWLLVWGAVALTVIRGLPVLWDAIPYMREIDRRKRAESA